MATTAPQSPDFETFFDEQIAPDLEAAEARRRKLVAGHLAARAGIVLAVIVFAATAALEVQVVHTIAEALGLVEILTAHRTLIGMLAFLVIIIAALGALYTYSKARGQLKDIVVSRICSYLDLGYEQRARAFPLGEFEQARMLPNFNSSALEDRITGTSDGVPFEMCEAHLKESSSGEDDRKRTVFRGILIRFDMPIAFSGRTLVTTDHKWLGNVLQQIGRKGERVELEDPRFEKLYEVYADDQIEARMLLKPMFLERMTALSETLAGVGNVRAQFEGNALRLALRTDRDMFEAGSMFSPLDPGAVRERIGELFGELSVVRTIMQTLDLEGEGSRRAH